MIKALLIDDEKSAVEELITLLGPYDDVILVVDYAHSVQEAVDKIDKHKPNLLLLDIELKDGTGFDLLNELGDVSQFQVVFVTGHNEYAIKAFKHSAVDYLLKPIRKEDISSTITKVIDNHNKRENEQKIELMLKSLQNQQFSKIAVPGVEGYEFLNKDEIMYCESDSSYTHIVTSSTKIISTQHLKKMNELLFEANFLRVHKSFLVNVNFVQKFSKSQGGFIIMEDNVEIPIARRRKDEFMRAMGL